MITTVILTSLSLSLSRVGHAMVGVNRSWAATVIDCSVSKFAVRMDHIANGQC